MATKNRSGPIRFAFGKVALRRVEPPEKGRQYVHDTGCPGLAMCTTAKGTKTYYYKKIDGRPVRIRLGKFPELTVEQARMLARRLIVDVAAGKNPQEEKQHKRRGWTLGGLLDYYLEQHAKPKKRTWRVDGQVFNRYLSQWENRLMASPDRFVFAGDREVSRP